MGGLWWYAYLNLRITVP